MSEILAGGAAGLVWLATILILLLTGIPLWDTNRWWVRAMDFPRLQIAIAGGVVLLAALVLLAGSSRALVAGLLILASGYQVWRIFPYTSFATSEVRLGEGGPGTIRVLSSNVLMENDRHDLLSGLIAEYDPDILLLMETDQAWTDAMEPVLGRYSTVLREPMENHYGMVFATRLDVREARMVRLTANDTPSVFAELVDADGTVFRFVGLHPKPPVPGEDTKDRDAQIYYAARFAAKSGMPMVVTGDFNDVAWSDTSRLFKHVGGYVDPRIGRGFFASFDARKPYLRFPIDQFYVTPDVVVVSIRRFGYIGSDHFPMAASIRLDAERAARLNTPPPPLAPDEQEQIETSVARTREMLQRPAP